MPHARLASLASRFATSAERAALRHELRGTRPRSAMSIVEQLFPRACLGCSRPLGAGARPLLLCARCRGRLSPIDRRRRCRACLRSLPTASAQTPLCLGCAARPPACPAVVAVWWYRPPLDSVLRALKFGRLEFLAAALVAEAAAREPLAALEPFDVVVPVPMPWLRRLARGFNQAASLGRAIARSTATVSADVLRRPLWERRQTGLGRRQRLVDPPAARLAAKRAVRSLAGARVLLVDDVVTTGATVNRCAAALRRAGVSSIAAFVLAATPAAAAPPLGAGSAASRTAECRP